MKEFDEALHDGYDHITHITDPQRLAQLRSDGILVDQYGYHSFPFGDTKEYEVCFEPYGEEGHYLVAVYKNRILLTVKIPICKQIHQNQ